eukprot:4556298-Pleurochrysis_carterae.AAC.2
MEREERERKFHHAVRGKGEERERKGREGGRKGRERRGRQREQPAMMQGQLWERDTGRGKARVEGRDRDRGSSVGRVESQGRKDEGKEEKEEMQLSVQKQKEVMTGRVWLTRDEKEGGRRCCAADSARSRQASSRRAREQRPVCGVKT